ncbi:MAG: polysaccharide pyruvyl transferase family protein [Crocinitomicaceae bacterium]
MKLIYHKGKNFGDAINPIVFNHFIGEYLNEDSSEVIVGIGSILGLFKKPENCKKIYVFSSGFAKGAISTYGEPIEIDDDFDIICLRGKGTAEAMGLNPDLGIADGALLLPLAYPSEPKKKRKYQFSFMPHSGTLDVFEDWKSICQSLDIHLIDPRKSPEAVMDELMDTEVLLAEAMHGGIIADAYRIPWIPVKTIATINEFKWKDYCDSVNLNYNPNRTDTLYSRSFLKEVFGNKLKQLSIFKGLAASLFFAYQKLVKLHKVKKQFQAITKQMPILSTDAIFKDKQNQLLTKMDELKAKISN